MKAAQNSLQNTAADVAVGAPSASTMSAWITGLTTTVALFIAILVWRSWDSDGITWLSATAMSPANQVALAVLLAAFVVMAVTETIRLHLSGNKPAINKAPRVNAEFWVICLVRYCEHLTLLWLIQLFYRTAGEYGFASAHPFYQPWHQFLDWFFSVYCWLGLPWIVALRLCKWDAELEKRDYGLLLEAAVIGLLRRFQPTKQWVVGRTSIAVKSIFLDLLVKLFFLPLMLVFFCDQLAHFINNLNYLGEGMPQAFVGGEFHHNQWNFDVANFVISALFTLHTGLAFCAIALSSRFLPKVNRVNDRLSGWLACLLTFPPFLHMVITQHLPGVTGPHLDGPSPILAQLPSPWIFTFALVGMSLCYVIYFAATVNLGAYFSEQTNRGIVQNGLYKRVRHPAYAAKLLGWLFVLAPLMGLNMVDGNWKVAFALCGAYVIGVALYISRALTEEKYLLEDPEYVAYCQKVPRRFLPGVW